jgi:hypothetical protein
MAGEESLLTVRVKVKRYFPNPLQKRRVGSARIAPRKMNRLYSDLSRISTIL